MIVNHVESKSILTKSKLPDADYVINPYIGCSHGCVYCYAEFMCRFTGHTQEKWGEFIDIKESYRMPNKGSIKGKTVLLGSSTDPYNPMEKKWEKTRSILKNLADSDAHVEILTKSPLVLRDMDILQTMRNIRVGISVSTTDQEFARIIERHAASPGLRFDAMRQLHKAGIPVYAFISPIFPFFSNYKAVVGKVEKYTDQICFENLNLRGAYKKVVLDLIGKQFPEKYHAFSLIY
ncbi:radical SAM mobile pair protein B [Spirochaetia bacterium]|nr:radical SAM mobile pair protein B [Spirochaetia bacterium]